MRHEKVIKKENTTVIIQIYIDVSCEDIWDYQVFQKSEKNIYYYNNPSAATPAEILEAKLELWNLIKPC